MIIIVTGHMGFVGQHLMKALLQINSANTIFGIDIKDEKYPRNILCEHLPLDVKKVYHLAAQTDAHCENAICDARTNIMGTLRLLDRYGDKVVLASSSMINYPVLPYSISKLACEYYAKYYGAAIVRFCNLYGEGGHSAIDKFKEVDEITINGSGEQRRTYAPVEHAVKALLNAMPGHTTILYGENRRVNDIAAEYNKPIHHKPAHRLDLMDGVQR